MNEIATDDIKNFAKEFLMFAGSSEIILRLMNKGKIEKRDSLVVKTLLASLTSLAYPYFYDTWTNTTGMGDQLPPHVMKILYQEFIILLYMKFIKKKKFKMTNMLVDLAALYSAAYLGDCECDRKQKGKTY